MTKSTSSSWYCSHILSIWALWELSFTLAHFCWYLTQHQFAVNCEELAALSQLPGIESKRRTPLDEKDDNRQNQNSMIHSGWVTLHTQKEREKIDPHDSHITDLDCSRPDLQATGQAEARLQSWRRIPADDCRGEAPAQPGHQQVAGQETGPPSQHPSQVGAHRVRRRPRRDRDRLCDPEAVHPAPDGAVRQVLLAFEAQVISEWALSRVGVFLLLWHKDVYYMVDLISASLIHKKGQSSVLLSEAPATFLQIAPASALIAERGVRHTSACAWETSCMKQCNFSFLMSFCIEL